MKLPFLGQAYQSRSPILASQTLVNLYAEGTEGNSGDVGAFYGTPGLIALLGALGEVRGLRTAGGMLYAAIGSHAYRISSAYVATDLGSFPNFAGPVSITDNGSQVAFAHADGWHWVSYTGSSIAPVTNSPRGSILTEMDNYVIFTTSTLGQFGITALADLSSIDPLDIASAEGAPDNLVSVLADHREVWLFGENTTEIWSDTGAQFFPFERSPGGFIEQGCIAMFSPAKLDNSVFWLGRDRNGQGVVYRANAYIPQRISTHALEFAINRYGDISDAIGFAYQEEGHTFYWLTFPSADVSWVYDVATNGWHMRGWLDTTTGLLHRHRANCHAFFNNVHIVGDWENGTIYQMSLDVGNDNGNEIYRERAFEVPDSENKRIRMDYLELVATTGDGVTPISLPVVVFDQFAFGTSAFGVGAFGSIGGAGDWTWDSGSVTFDSGAASFDGFASGASAGSPGSQVIIPPLSQVWMQLSKDGGRTWGYKRFHHMGKIGNTKKRLRWRHMGMGRNIVIRFGTTSSSRVHWLDAFGRGEALEA
jgi:Phage stabilisation protein